MNKSGSNKSFWCAVALVAGLFAHNLGKTQPALETWVQRYNGMAESDDRARKLVLDASGNVLVVGSSDAGINGSDWLILKYSNGGVPLWTNFYSGPDNSLDSANAAVVDRSDNVIVTGRSVGDTSMGGGQDYATIKYSSTGLPLWTNRYSGPPSYWGDFTNSVAVDSSGNVFVTGGTATIAYSTAGVPLWTNLYPAAVATGVAVDGSGDVFVTGRAGSYDDIVTVKYSQAGVPLWTNRYIMCGYGHGFSVAVDGSGNVFVAGGTDCSGFATVAYSSAGLPLWANHGGELGFFDQRPTANGLTLDSSGNVFVTGRSGGDYTTVAYSNTGLPLWTNLYHGPGIGDDGASGVAVDGGGNVYVTGSSRGTGGHYDYATIKYSGAGVPLWTNRYTGPGDSHATAVAVDGGGNVFVTGYSWSGSSYDYATISYSSAGVPLWTNRFDRLSETDDQARAVAVDGRGNVFVTGSSSGSGASRYTTFAYSSGGVPLWTNRYITPGNSVHAATAAVVDASGDVIVTGRSSLGSIRDPYASLDFATIKYSNAGVPLWTNRYDGPRNGNDEATAVAVDAVGNVFVTGRSEGTNGFHSYATIKYAATGIPVWTNRSATKPYNQPTAMAVDPSGNVIVTGEAWGGNTSVSSDYVTIKYSGEGAPAWTNRFNGRANSSDAASAVAVDARGNVFVTGYSWSGDPYTGSFDYATIKYSESGVPLWTNRYAGSGGDTARAMAVDSNGDAVVTGNSGGDYATIKYSSTGVALWTNRYNGPGNSSDYATAIAVDVSGNVFVAGNSSGTSGWPDYDYATIKYSSAGVPLWTNRYSGSGNLADYAWAVAVDGNGDAFVTGESWNGSTYDYVTIKYSSAGMPLLTITRTAKDTVAVSWPSASLGFTLQQNTGDFASSNWSDVVATPADDGAIRTVILNSSAKSALFRLIHP